MAHVTVLNGAYTLPVSHMVFPCFHIVLSYSQAWANTSPFTQYQDVHAFYRYRLFVSISYAFSQVLIDGTVRVCTSSILELPISDSRLPFSRNIVLCISGWNFKYIIFFQYAVCRRKSTGPGEMNLIWLWLMISIWKKLSGTIESCQTEYMSITHSLTTIPLKSVSRAVIRN